MTITRTVLLVEDDYDVRETIAEVLGDEGYQVVTAADGPSRSCSI
jgi:CheY-like chemotaxis protein